MQDEKRKLLRLEIAKTGTFGATGSVITKQHLQDVVETFDGKAPISLGHYMTKQDWWPSWGNVENIYLKEDGEQAVLIADISVTEALYDAIKDGFYPAWSVSIPERASDGKRYLHHLAFVGATPPKIRDLKFIISSDTAPENAIKVEGEGFAFADLLEFSQHDFSDFSFKEIDEDGKEVIPEETEGGKTQDKDFADSPLVKKAKAVFSRSIKERLDAALKDRLPAGKMDLVSQFADEACRDFDFADDEEEPKLISLFLDIVNAMETRKNVPETGRTSFADNPQKEQHIDINSLAKRF